MELTMTPSLTPRIFFITDMSNNQEGIVNPATFVRELLLLAMVIGSFASNADVTWGGLEGTYEGKDRNGNVCRLILSDFHTENFSSGDDAGTNYVYKYALSVNGSDVATFSSRALHSQRNLVGEVGEVGFDPALDRQIYLRETMVFTAPEPHNAGQLTLTSSRDVLEYLPNGNVVLSRTESVQDVACANLSRIN